MKQSPLFAVHQAHRAELGVHGDWMRPDHYGDVDAEVAAIHSGAAIADLAHVAVQTLRGDEVRRWCHGMFTNHVERLQPGQGNRHAMCDDRGRVQGLLDLYCLDATGFLAALEGVDSDWFAERYKMFLILDDIEVEPFHGGGPTLVTIQGPRASEVLEALKLPVPTADHDHVAVGEGDDALRVMAKDRTGSGGFDLLVPAEALPSLFEAAVAAGARPVGEAALDAARIGAGLARWPDDGNDRSYVHELRLDPVVCNFEKGCYVGQEVINRIDVKGQVNKMLYGLVLAEDALPPHDAEVYSGDAAVGRITSSARIEGRPVALGILRRTVWEPGTAVTIRAGDREVSATVADLPLVR